jgi:hypothetical protein
MQGSETSEENQQHLHHSIRALKKIKNMYLKMNTSQKKKKE